MSCVERILEVLDVPFGKEQMIYINELVDPEYPLSLEHIYISHFLCSRLIDSNQEDIGKNYFETIVYLRGNKRFLNYCLGRLYHSLNQNDMAKLHYDFALQGLSVSVEMGRPLGWCDTEVISKGIYSPHNNASENIDSGLFRFDNKSSTEAMLVSLGKFGVACIDGFYDGEYIKSLRDELEINVTRRDQHYRSLNENVNVITLGRMTAGEKNEIPVICKTFDNEWMNSIATSYLESACKVNYLIFFTHHKSSNCHITQVHYDEFKGLKYFIYLDDVDETNGALKVLPRSQSIVKVLTNACNELGIINFYRPNTIFSEDGGGAVSRLYFVRESIRENRGRWPVLYMDSSVGQELVSITGRAGTLIVFDTHTIHQGGRIQKECQRSIVRGHCATLEEIKKDDLRYKFAV